MNSGTETDTQERNIKIELPLNSGTYSRDRDDLIAKLSTFVEQEGPSASERFEYFRQKILAFLKKYQTISQHAESEGSTIEHEVDKDVEKRISSLFELANVDGFEDGVENEFSEQLSSYVKKYGDDAMQVLAHLIVSEKVAGEVAAEALRSLGQTAHAQSYNYRRWLLERSLFCSSAYVREGAVLGLADLDDPHAISSLEQAIQREQRKMLRKTMEQVLAQLQSTR